MTLANTTLCMVYEQYTSNRVYRGQLGMTMIFKLSPCTGITLQDQEEVIDCVQLLSESVAKLFTAANQVFSVFHFYKLIKKVGIC